MFARVATRHHARLKMEPNFEANSSDRFLPARQVWSRYGVCDMTLHRWVRDERMNFPRPIYFGRLRFWKLADLESWERSRAVRATPVAA
jgi:predicted DNA-binding transcriptional regulator AlpA